MIGIRNVKTLIFLLMASYCVVSIVLYVTGTDKNTTTKNTSIARKTPTTTVTNSAQSISHNGFINNKYNSKWNKYVVGLKTSTDTAAARVPIQLLTFLRHISNVYFFGDSVEELGDTKVYDVVHNLYKDGNLSVIDVNGQLSTSKNGVSNGWIMDAHKNLPGFKKLYELYPDRDWYLMLDDDTYLLFENLDSELKDLNPAEPYYFGAYFSFVGCGGIKNHGDGPDFAHGGSGIVVSRGALQRMIKVIDDCIVDYRTCWAGDVRVALCLRDANVTLDRRFHGRFINAEPDVDLDWPDNPCSYPLTFHHLKPKTIYELYATENRVNKENRPTNYADIFKSIMAHQHEGGIQDNTDIKGYPFAQTRTINKEKCKDVCRENIKCRAYVYDENGICWLKGSIQKTNSVEQSRSSGFITNNYICEENEPKPAPTPTISKLE
ncbi:glycoprotein-N-acetylgalactosamine 3-beta-galactosyltransferase [Acrasis kona]|uniref:N-acetylgalactosaminide beta-1,3-galactosyltransferase n=1 Tax=Acrasis kona TaxID=1008807 RepID=A0AAW2Z787_9EUKA